MKEITFKKVLLLACFNIGVYFIVGMINIRRLGERIFCKNNKKRYKYT